MFTEMCRDLVTYNRARLNIIGPEDAGKTTLCERLLGAEFKENIKSTEGITIHAARASYYMQGKKTGKWVEAKSDGLEAMKEFFDCCVSKLCDTARPQKNVLPKKILGRKENSAKCMGFQLTTPSSQNELSIPTHVKDEMMAYFSRSVYSKDFTLNIWDFGGQTAFIATHNMFLDVDSVTLLVMDITKYLRQDIKGATNATKGIPTTPLDFLCYWMETIYCKAQEKKISPNVALVLTHKDDIEGVNPKQYIEEYTNEVLKALKGKAYGPLISKDNIYVVDNKSKHAGELNSLRHKIFKKITSEKNWGKQIPGKWLLLGADILNVSKENTRNYMHVSMVREMASSLDIADDELQSFLDFHHSLGSLVHYNDPPLKDTIITNPQWLVDIFKTLITAEEFIDSRSMEEEVLNQLKGGTVSRKSLEILWQGNNIDFLAALMVKFNLMLMLHSTGQMEAMFIIPCMLPKSQLDMYAKEPFINMELVYNSTHGVKKSEGIPVGAYHKMLCRSAKRKNWELCQKDHLSYTDASFKIHEGTRLAMTLLQKESKIRISVWCDRTVDYGELRSILATVRKNCETTLYKLGITENNSFLIMCPMSIAGDQCLVRMKETEFHDELGSRFEPQDDKCQGHNTDFSRADFKWLFRVFTDISLSALCQGMLVYAIKSIIYDIK